MEFAASTYWRRNLKLDGGGQEGILGRSLDSTTLKAMSGIPNVPHPLSSREYIDRYLLEPALLRFCVRKVLRINWAQRLPRACAARQALSTT